MSKIRVVSERYYPIEVDLKSFTNFSGILSLFVKKKSGHLSYIEDPHGLRSLAIQNGGSNGGPALELIKSFTEDPKLLAYAEFLCRSNIKDDLRDVSSRNHRNLSHLGISFTSEDFYSDILHECLTQEKPESIFLYLALHDSIGSIERKVWPVGIVWNIRLLCSYYANRVCSEDVELLSTSFVANLCESIDRFFMQLGFKSSDIAHNMGSHKRRLNAIIESEQWIGSYVIWISGQYPRIVDTV